MKITRTDYLRILYSELRDPTTEARRKAFLEGSRHLGKLTPEALAKSVPVSPRKLKQTSQ